MRKLYENLHILHFQKRIVSVETISRKYGMQRRYYQSLRSVIIFIRDKKVMGGLKIVSKRDLKIVKTP